MRPVEIAKGIYSVGVRDWNIRDFHGYATDQGTTYNAFLIVDEKIALIDTVKNKKQFTQQLIDNIATIIDPKKIDLVVSNHTEMDHSGGLPHIMHYIGENKPIYCSKMGKKNLAKHFSRSWNYHAVKNGEELSLGKKTLAFLETRMIHWPDSMFTLAKEDGVLFSSDGFGQHYAGYELFDDQVSEKIMYEAKKYFANILMLYAPRIKKLIKGVTDLGLEIKMICPDHGIIWRKNPAKIINAYNAWCDQTPIRKALVVYDTMWESTERMAEAIADGLIDENVITKLMHVRTCHRSDVITEMLDTRAVLMGSPTLNNQMFPTLMDNITYIKGLKPINKIAAAFGSYGWSGEAVKFINKEFEAMKFEIVDSGIRVQYVPTPDDLKKCFQLGVKVGKLVKES
ncbi:flavodoxin domain-containing protein [Desulfococcaceae bacterium HSG9]|nr:flavodoxin domain-containing protein [Desulfococcaceae bacterium HSG9]